jgi:uncharacterized protein YjbI with pentapeptide repeats
VLPVSHKYKRLNQVAAEGMTSLFQQGGIVLSGFVAMLVITGGAPSGLAVGLTVGLSGLFVAWSEQNRLARLKHSKTIKNLSEPWLKISNPSEQDLQKWLAEVIPKGISPNKTAILRRKLSQIALETKEIEKIQPLLCAIRKSKDDFLGLAALAELDPLHDFSKADLSGINLSTFISEADFHGANLSEVNLQGANLNGLNLYKVNLESANLSETALSWAYLFDADLQDVNLSNANLYGANLSKANLQSANLSKADLKLAKLIDANLLEADLSGANLSGANVTNAQFFSSYGISLELKQDLQNRGAIFEDASGDRERLMSRK